MPDRLYLDTARLGLMSPSAQQIHIDFVRFAAEEAGSLYCDEFLRQGTRDWPSRLQDTYPALALWRGIGNLKQDLRQLAGASADSNVLLASRSAQLMKLAAEILFRRCHNVLVTDLTWPSYRRILGRRCQQARLRLTKLSLRDLALHEHVTRQELIDVTVNYYRRHECDGLFLPAVDNLGIRLPVRQIVRAIEKRSEVRFVAVDAAQAFCHVPLEMGEDYADLVIAGSHKWLGAYHPLGIGFHVRRRSSNYISETCRQMLASGELDDPLLRFANELETRRGNAWGETVGVAPLLGCQSAAHDALSRKQALPVTHRQLLHNANALLACLDRSGWAPLLPETGLRSGITLIQSRHPAVRDSCPDAIRRRFHEARVAVTAYRRGMVRLSMPTRAWADSELDLLGRALVHAGCG